MGGPVSEVLALLMQEMEKDFAEKTYAWPAVSGWIRAARLFKDGCDHIIQVVSRIGVIISFREAVDKYSWIWYF